MSLEDNRSLQEVATTDLEQPVEVSSPGMGNPESSDMWNLLAGMEKLAAAPLTPGEIVQGKVLKVADGEIVIDLGLKTEVTAPFTEFLNNEGQVTVAPGDSVDIWIESSDETTGRVRSRGRRPCAAKSGTIWAGVPGANHDHRPGARPHKGGLTVDMGVPAFLPASHAHPGASQR